MVNRTLNLEPLSLRNSLGCRNHVQYTSVYFSILQYTSVYFRKLYPISRFAFVEYESHRSAAMARRKLMNGRVQLWGHHIAVDWAEPELEVDEEIMAQVKE